MADNAELARLIERSTDTLGDGLHETAIPRLHLIRSSTPTAPLHVVHEPAVCFVVQGAKKAIMGDQVIRYGGGCFLVVSVDVPVVGQIITASEEEPYLCLRLGLDAPLLAGLMLEAGVKADGGAVPALSVGETPADLLDALCRLVRLLESPADIPLLAPLVEREILYRLLKGEQGERLAQIGSGESRLNQVNRAISWLKTNYDQPFRMETLAREARMSPSALHQHFKAVTAMSPLQYQKQLRLQEARRLIVSHAADAATAGHRVGYDSPSQFSREYARLFGEPPMRDAQRLRGRSMEVLEAVV